MATRLTKKPMRRTEAKPAKTDESPKMSWGFSRLERWWRANAGSAKWEGAYEGLFDSVSAFPFCCAFYIVHNFALHLRRFETEDIKRAAVCLSTINAVHAPYVLAATSDEQGGAERFLEEIGFEELKTVHNPNSGNRVTLWLASTRP